MQPCFQATKRPRASGSSREPSANSRDMKEGWIDEQALDRNAFRRCRTGGPFSAGEGLARAHPPELIEKWLMKNDFKPVVDHAFTLRADWGAVDCKVLAVEPNKTLSYTWAAYGLESIVTWTLTPASAGTHLRMEQSGFRPDQPQYYEGAKGGEQSSSLRWSKSWHSTHHGSPPLSSRKGEALSGIVTHRSASFLRSRLALRLAGTTTGEGDRDDGWDQMAPNPRITSRFNLATKAAGSSGISPSRICACSNSSAERSLTSSWRGPSSRRRWPSQGHGEYSAPGSALRRRLALGAPTGARSRDQAHASRPRDRPGCPRAAEKRAPRRHARPAPPSLRR